MRARLETELGQGYRVERELGGGGMSRVFVATDTELGRQVVIKVLPPEWAIAMNQDRFRREVQVVARLQHPHIVPLLSAGGKGDLSWYVMPLIEGESLRDRVAREVELPVPDAVKILREVADALGYAHRHGVIHRDIKPANVLLSGGHAMVADFGVAKAVTDAGSDRLTSTGMAVGTPTYMAPEQAIADPHIDHRADLYALGALGYELLTGEPPFRRATPQASVAAAVLQPPVPITTLRPGVPASLSALIERCLQKRPADRPQSAEEIVAALDVIAAGTGAVPSFAPGEPALQRRLTPRRILFGGGIAAAAAVVVIAVLLALRALGIGPLASLVSIGKLKERERIIIADFADHTRDTLLGQALTQAFHVDLAQSPIVSLVERDYVLAVLQRMQRPAGRLDVATAREVAVRAGVKAVVAGDIRPAGSLTMISAELVLAESGEVLAAYRESARDSTEILPAVGRVSRRLRSRIGESLRSVRASPPLEDVTTSSLDALRKYSMGLAADNADRDAEAVTLLGEAVAIDSNFAMAWRKLGVTLQNQQIEPNRAIAALKKAFALRDRLTERERRLTENSYYNGVLDDSERAAQALTALLQRHPDDAWALNNLGVANAMLGDETAADSFYRKAIALQPESMTSSLNLVINRLHDGKFDSAEAALHRFNERFADTPSSKLLAMALEYHRGNYTGGDSLARAALNPNLGPIRPRARRILASSAMIQGRLAEALAVLKEEEEAYAARGVPAAALEAAAFRALAVAALGNRPAEAKWILEAAMTRYQFETLPPADRPHWYLVRAFAAAGDGGRARQLLADYEQAANEGLGRFGRLDLENARGAVASEIDHDDGKAILFFRQGLRAMCEERCSAELGTAFAATAQPDSALHWLEQYANGPDGSWYYAALVPWRANVYWQLAELYQLKGDRERALEYFGKFVELWRNADPALQPRVAAAKRRMAELVAEPRP